MSELPTTRPERVTSTMLTVSVLKGAHEAFVLEVGYAVRGDRPLRGGCVLCSVEAPRRSVSISSVPPDAVPVAIFRVPDGYRWQREDPRVIFHSAGRDPSERFDLFHCEFRFMGWIACVATLDSERVTGNSDITGVARYSGPLCPSCRQVARNTPRCIMRMEVVA